MKIAKASIEKNPFIGLFLKTNDEATLVPRRVSKKIVSLAEETLGTHSVELLVSQSPLLGIFCSLNNNGVVLPCSAEEHEFRVLKKLGLNVCRLSSPFAPGNVLLANDFGALASPLLPRKDVELVGDCLGVDVFQKMVGGFTTVGAFSVATNNGVFAGAGANESEKEFLKKVFRVPAIAGSTNLGCAFNALSVVGNSKGALVGELTSGAEVQKVFEALSE